MKNKTGNFIQSLKRNASLLDFITLFIVTVIFFVGVRLVLNVLHYIPSFFLLIILFILAVLVGLSLTLARLISRSAIREIAERERAEEASLQQLKRLHVLNSIEKSITSSLDLEVTLEVLVSQVTSKLNIDAASILLLKQETQTLEYVVNRGFRSGALQFTRLKLGESNAGRAATERRIITIPNLKEDPGGFEHSTLFSREDFVTYYAVPLIAKGEVEGVLELFHRSPLGSDPEWIDFLKTIANQASVAIDNATLFDRLQRSNVELSHAYDTTIEGWARALELKDRETKGHTQRVTDKTISIARELGLPDEEIVHIKRGALLHDMGKMGIPDSILLKPGPLTEEEWSIMKQHPEYAYEMLQPIPYLRPSLDIPFCHHEKWDGTGYPRGLRKENIPLAARIFAVVDVWDALCSNRPYRRGWPEAEVKEHIRSLAGTHFCPDVTEMFLNSQL